MTNQAMWLVTALRSIGLRERSSRKGPADFHVRTTGSGSSPEGFGDAYAIVYSQSAIDMIYDNAEKLVSTGLLCVDRWTVQGKKCAHVNTQPRAVALRDFGECESFAGYAQKILAAARGE